MSQQQSQNSTSGRFAWQTPPLTSRGRTVVSELAARHGFSEASVAEMMAALQRGGGTQAQFDHPDLGGMGQWSRGGMLMIGDMFNDALKAKVGALAADAGGELAGGALFETPPAPVSMQWSGVRGMPTWPSELGVPAATGSQNGMQYAFFPERQRLALLHGGVMEIYDTQDHRILGFGQQQGGSSSLTFTSQHGVVALDSLRRLPLKPDEDGAAPMSPAAQPREPAPATDDRHRRRSESRAEPEATASSAVGPKAEGRSVLELIEGLAGLHAKGILNDEEFAAKKAELLARL